MYTQLIRAEIQKVLSELKTEAIKVEGEIVHVAKADFEALVTRVEALEKRSVFLAQSRSQAVIADVKTEAAKIETAVKTDAAKVEGDVKTEAEKVATDIKQL